MLEPEIVKVPDFSKYIGKEFVFLEDFKTGMNITYFAGMRFVIKKIKDREVSIKIISPIEECKLCIENFAHFISNRQRNDIKLFDKIIKIWEDEPDQFYIIPDNYWNKQSDSNNDYRGGSCINTGYNKIPRDHPMKYGMAKPYKDYPSDTIMTYNYRHKTRNGMYSYQETSNEWYSKECYEFMRLSQVERAESYELLSDSLRKELYKQISGKFEFTISKLNKGKFKLVK